MAKIGGNIKGVLQIQSGSTNSIGEPVSEWTDAAKLNGWFGLQTGDHKYENYNAKIEESTHVFLCDYRPEVYALATQDARMIIKSRVYDVLLIDNPDEMDEQLEIYLKMVGGFYAGD